MPARTPELTGQVFTDLFVKDRVSPPSHLKTHTSTTYYLCECRCSSPNCFKTLIVRKDHLISGNTKSCKANKNCLTTIEQIKRASFNNVYSRGRYNHNDITLDQFIILSSSNCFYCNSPPLKKNNDFIKNKGAKFSIEHGTIFYNGLDRIDSLLPHELSNVVPCCYICNRFKLERTYIEVLNHIPHLNENFRIKLIDEFSVVREQIKLYQNGIIPAKNPKGKTILAKLYPENYDKASRSYLQFMAYGFVRNAKKEKKICEFSIEEAAELMMANCVYCNEPPDLIRGEFNGIDRFRNFDDQGNKTGYLRNNSTPACFWCNSAKGQLSIDEFRNWIIRIKDHYDKLPKSEQELLEYVKIRNLNF